MPPTPGSSRISGSSETISIAPIDGAADIAIAHALFSEYGESIKHVALLTGFARELATLPGHYAPPTGTILIARDGEGLPLGCTALHRLPDGAAEIKRLYVRPGVRRGGIGRALAEAVIEAARAMGYGEVRLDSLPSMVEAQKLYRALGFAEIERYNDNPNPGLVFMNRKL